jgi:hypothetical protein
MRKDLSVGKVRLIGKGYQGPSVGMVRMELSEYFDSGKQGNDRRINLYQRIDERWIEANN